MGKKVKRPAIQSPKKRRPTAPRTKRSARPRNRADVDARVFRGMVAANPDRMSYVDRNYIYREVNDAYLRAHNCSRDMIVGRHVADVFGKETFERTIKPHFDACLAGTKVRYQDWFEFGALGRRFVDVIYNPFLDADGTVSGVVVTARDFTEAHLTDAALHETRMRLNLVLSTIEDVVWITDWSARKIKFVSPAYKAIWGCSVDEIYRDAEIWMSAIHPDDQSRVRRAFRDIEKTLHFDQEYRIVRPDGSIRWIHDRGVATRDPGGRTIQIAGIARDVSERKRLEQALSKERQRVRAFLGNSAVVAWMKDADGRYVFVTDNLTRRFQIPADRWLGSTDPELWPHDIAEQFQANDRKVLESRQTMESVERATDPDGTLSW